MLPGLMFTCVSAVTTRMPLATPVQRGLVSAALSLFGSVW